MERGRRAPRCKHGPQLGARNGGARRPAGQRKQQQPRTSHSHQLLLVSADRHLVLQQRLLHLGSTAVDNFFQPARKGEAVRLQTAEAWREASAAEVKQGACARAAHRSISGVAGVLSASTLAGLREAAGAGTGVQTAAALAGVAAAAALGASTFCDCTASGVRVLVSTDVAGADIAKGGVAPCGRVPPATPAARVPKAADSKLSARIIAGSDSQQPRRKAPDKTEAPSPGALAPSTARWSSSSCLRCTQLLKSRRASAGPPRAPCAPHPR